MRAVGGAFLRSKEGRFLGTVHSFLGAAEYLLTVPEDRRGEVFRPTHFLAAHGLELMIKACLILNKKKVKKEDEKEAPQKKKNGHDIAADWASELCEKLRYCARVHAAAVGVEMQQHGYLNPDLTEDGHRSVFDMHVSDLIALLGESGYPLRYPSADGSKKAPPLPFMVTVLHRTANEFLEHPMDFRIKG